MEIGEASASASSQARTQTSSDTPVRQQRQHHADLDTCVICLQAISERAITVPCDHYMFDFICLASWLSERSTCPLCTTEVTEVQYDWRSPEDFKSYGIKPTKGGDFARNNALRLPHRRALRSAARNGRNQHPAPNPALTEDEAILRRRHVYRRQLYSLHVGSNRVSRYRNFNPRDFSSDTDLQSRARKWIRRELRVFRYLHPTTHTSEAGFGQLRRANNAEFLLEYIIAILKTVDIKDSGGQAENMLMEFLGRDDAKLFLHELNAWLKSPYDQLRDWDRHVQYSDLLSSAPEGSSKDD